MRTNLKTRLGLIGAGTGVAALAVTGLALPANADDTSVNQDSSTTETTTDLVSSLDAFQAWLSDTLAANDNTVAPVTGVSPDTSVGDVSLVEGPLVGDVLSNNQAPVGSGNDTPIGSGNDVSAPVGSGNDVSAPVDAGNGNDVSAPVDAPVGSGNSSDAGISVGDIGADVDNLVGDLTNDLGLGSILNR
jgi:hypothetical protein